MSRDPRESLRGLIREATKEDPSNMVAKGDMTNPPSPIEKEKRARQIRLEELARREEALGFGFKKTEFITTLGREFDLDDSAKHRIDHRLSSLFGQISAGLPVNEAEWEKLFINKEIGDRARQFLETITDPRDTKN